MHELGIAEAALSAIEIEAARFPGTRVVRVGMRVGELAGVNSEALRFAFEAITQGTSFEAMQLEIEYCRRKQKCANCQYEFEVSNYDLQCTQCLSLRTDYIGGEQLDLAFVEVEEYATT